MPSSILKIGSIIFPQYLHSVTISFTPYLLRKKADLRLIPNRRLDPFPLKNGLLSVSQKKEKVEVFVFNCLGLFS
jgi:hypothetical protein